MTDTSAPTIRALSIEVAALRTANAALVAALKHITAQSDARWAAKIACAAIAKHGA